MRNKIFKELISGGGGAGGKGKKNNYEIVFE